jgi:hypothetical protein
MRRASEAGGVTDVRRGLSRWRTPIARRMLASTTITAISKPVTAVPFL